MYSLVSYIERKLFYLFISYMSTIAEHKQHRPVMTLWSVGWKWPLFTQRKMLNFPIWNKKIVINSVAMTFFVIFHFSFSPGIHKRRAECCRLVLRNNLSLCNRLPVTAPTISLRRKQFCEVRTTNVLIYNIFCCECNAMFSKVE